MILASHFSLSVSFSHLTNVLEEQEKTLRGNVQEGFSWLSERRKRLTYIDVSDFWKAATLRQALLRQRLEELQGRLLFLKELFQSQRDFSDLSMPDEERKTSFEYLQKASQQHRQALQQLRQDLQQERKSWRETKKPFNEAGSVKNYQ